MQGEAATRSLRASYHLRSRLFPYIYTSVRQTHETMVPLIRQMYIDYPEADEAYENPQQYLFGDLLLVAPITTPGKGDNKIAAQTVWFPEGDTWYDWFSGKAYPGGQKPGVAKGLDEFPLFARGGWIIPMQPYTPRPGDRAARRTGAALLSGCGRSRQHLYALRGRRHQRRLRPGRLCQNGPQLPPRGQPGDDRHCGSERLL